MWRRRLDIMVVLAILVCLGAIIMVFTQASSDIHQRSTQISSNR